VLLVTVAAQAGCGASSSSTQGTVVTVAAYGPHSATTVSGSASPAACLEDARIFARDALALLAHSSSSAAYPADLYYVITREDIADFEARRCNPKALGDVLDRRLTALQRRALVAYLPHAMAQIVRQG